MKDIEIKNYVVVGGGTAGWITASLLATKLSNDKTKSVTLIESPDIPIIGVGEGTVPSIRQTLKRIGISESELITKCDATFKQSIKFANWMDKETHGEKNFYHHLFDYPFPFGDNLLPFWHKKKGSSFAEMVSIQQHLAELNLAPKNITDAEFTGISDYAYHFDAHKFAQLLKENAVEKLGVNYISDNVEDVTIDSEIGILALKLQKNGMTKYDFYIDCSGFTSLILGQKLAVPFIDKSNVIFSNKALTVQVPNLDKEIPPFTISTAHQAGWIWDIALSTRRGIGLVYCDRYMSEDTAREKLEKYVGSPLEEFNVRKIDMKIGYREQAWHKNCLAIGLSQGFVEPLEATAILLSDFSANLFCNKLPEHASDLEDFAKHFNKRITYTWERVIDFVKLHYCISNRSDSQFWLDNRDMSSIPSSLTEKLSLWMKSYPSKDDFFSKFEVFDLENYLYVLAGMDFSFKDLKMSDHELARYENQTNQVLKTFEEYKNRLPKQRELIKKVLENGFPKI